MKRASTIVKEINRMGFKAFQRNTDTTPSYPAVYVSAENGDDAADYYGEFRGGYPWINPKLVRLAEKNGLMWEWQNPGCIGLYGW